MEAPNSELDIIEASIVHLAGRARKLIVAMKGNPDIAAKEATCEELEQILGRVQFERRNLERVLE